MQSASGLIKQDQRLSRLLALDQAFHCSDSAVDDGWFEVVQGIVPVLVSAPHACLHERDGVAKTGEEYTGAFARYLAEVCHCHAIFTRCEAREDPNWQTDSQYKTAISQLVSETDIQFLIDLHGMTNKHHMGVAIGTIHGKSCDPEVVLPHFIRAGFELTDLDDLLSDAEAGNEPVAMWRKLAVDHPKFTGGVVNHTVTRFAVTELGIPSVQIELASEARVVESLATQEWPSDYYGKPEAIIATITALCSLVGAFA